MRWLCLHAKAVAKTLTEVDASSRKFNLRTVFFLVAKPTRKFSRKCMQVSKTLFKMLRDVIQYLK